MNELVVMFVIYVVSILSTAVLWFATTKKNEIGDIHFAVGLLLTGPVAFLITLYDMWEMRGHKV